MRFGRSLLRGILGGPRDHSLVSTELERLSRLAVSDYIEQHLTGAGRYRETGRLNRHEFQVYSQSGEDGILDEIFNRIGTTNRWFVEIGAGDGVSNNTAFRLASGWQGLWIEAGASRFARLASIHQAAMAGGRLRTKNVSATAENVESLLREQDVPAKPDLLSIDIDGNDYWIWHSIRQYQPRVVVIEYNASYPASVRWIKPYEPSSCWDGTTFFGASLKALETLGREKGYSLVGCSFSGVNAFFVKKELVRDRFHSPYTAENHYEPPRYFLILDPPFPRRFAPGIGR